MVGTKQTEVQKPQASGGHYNVPVNFTYAVRVEGGTIYPFVRNLQDFAGVQGRKITDIAIKCDVGSVSYRVHVLGRGWLPFVSGCNWNDGNNGYAGIGRVIDAVQVIYHPPVGSWQKAQYRISPVKRGYYSWQYNDETGGGQDGYAGAFGVPMDRFQLF